MAIRIPIITDLQDQGLKQAKIAFGNFKTAVSEAQGGLGKFKAGAKSVMDTVEKHAATFAIAAGAAFAAFAVKGINAFQDLAIEASKFSKATGLAVEDASRWMEVAGDIGIGSDQLQTAIGRMNKTVGANPDLFKNLGIDLEYTNTGALDVNKTFLKTIDHLKNIKDPAEKAKVASQLLGKGWQSMAELIGIGADQLTKSLADVEDSKIIDKEEVKKAENYRAAMDTLRDSFEKMAINLGERLIPKVAQLLELLAKLPELLRGSGGVIEDAFSVEYMASIGDETAIARLEFERLAEMYGGYYASRAQGAKDDTYKLQQAVEDLKDQVSLATTKWQIFKDELNLKSESEKARDELDKLKQVAVEAYQGAAGALADYEQGLIDAKLMVLDLAETITLTDTQKNQIRILVDTGQLERAIDMINIIAAGGYTPELNAMRNRGTHGSAPNALPPGFDMSGFGTSSSSSSTNTAATTVTVNVNGGDPDSVVKAIQKYARQNGAIPLQTTTGVRV